MIEVDGERWHGPDRKQYALKRDEFLKSEGFKVVHLLASKILEDASVVLNFCPCGADR